MLERFTVSRCRLKRSPIRRFEASCACSAKFDCFWHMLISFAIADSAGGKNQAHNLRTLPSAWPVLGAL